MSEPSTSRISVSEDKLRAELYQLELRLLSALRIELDRKAEKVEVEALSSRVAFLERAAVKIDDPVVSSVADIATAVAALKKTDEEEEAVDAYKARVYRALMALTTGVVAEAIVIINQHTSLFH